MIRKNEVSKALDGAFRAAFMLTGCTQAAEHAVLDGIAATEFDNVKRYEQGTVLGLNQSLQSVAQILAPLAMRLLSTLNIDFIGTESNIVLASPVRDCNRRNSQPCVIKQSPFRFRNVSSALFC